MGIERRDICCTGRWVVCGWCVKSDADVGGYRSSTPMASIRMTGSKFAARKSGGSRLVRWSIWYVLSVTRKNGKEKMAGFVVIQD